MENLLGIIWLQSVKIPPTNIDSYRRIIKSSGHDRWHNPDIFIVEVYYSWDELVDMGEVFNDDSMQHIVLERLTDECLHI